LDGSHDYYADGFSVHNKTCFVPGTKILLPNGKSKAVQDLKVGEVVLGAKGAHNKVVDLVVHPKAEHKIYAFNGGRYFVTDAHPFMTREGWKAIDPQASYKVNPQLKVGALKIGDEVATRHGWILLKKIEYKIINSVVYDPVLDGSHDYFADGYSVHNKIGTCLAPGTKILLPNGKSKEVQDLKVGDVVLGSWGAHNKVTGLVVHHKGDWEIYSVNGGRYFVTNNHVLRTTTGWAAIEPKLAVVLEDPGLKIAKLKVGDVLITIKGRVRIKTISSVVAKDSIVYNPTLDGTHEYYADGFLVHNAVTDSL
jgi:hypothetical protein